MTQANTPAVTAPVAPAPIPITGDDIALAIAARVAAKRLLETSLANHQAQVTKISTQHTAIQAEIDAAKSAYESGQSWTVPADSVLTRMQAEASAKSAAQTNLRNRVGTAPRPLQHAPAAAPPAAGSIATNQTTAA